MKISVMTVVDYKASMSSLYQGLSNNKNMLLPGASTCTIASSSCSCGAVVKK